MTTLFLLTLTGCDHSLDHLDGRKLGRPESAVFGASAEGQIMVVFSDLPELCPLLFEQDPPFYKEFWIVTAWTEYAYLEDEAQDAGGFAVLAQGSSWDEYDADVGALMIDRLDDDALSGKVDLLFSTGDPIWARFEAEPCDAPLFLMWGAP